MSAQFVTELTILMLAIFLGFEVISKVPTLLHTPLMSGTNAIHGIVIVGAIIVTGTPTRGCSCRSCPSSPWCSRPQTSSVVS
jgi:NAD/NADP transhydrogenase alpha subunit